jgi:zeta-carotene desaturase
VTTPAGGRGAVVLGGGVAGLVAAFGLADAGYRVTLLESRGWLGGRAFSFVDRASGARLDNGPHAMLGCYRAMRALLRRLGTEDRFAKDRALRIAYRTASGRIDRLALAALPVPLAMPWALLRLGVPFGERLRALWGMGAVLRSARESWSVDDWLAARAQRGAPAAYLWRPMCRAIMNVEPGDASARDFLATLRAAFLGSAGAGAFWLPRATWGEILADPAPVALARAGVTLRTGARAVGLDVRDGRVVRITIGDGASLDVAAGDVVVSALPWFALQALVPAAGKFGALRSSPIVTAHFVFADGAAAPPDDGPLTALVDGDPFHFVYRTPGADRRCVAIFSGGSRSFDGMQVDAIEELARTQLARHFPGFAAAAPAQVRISKEDRATFVADPGSRELRPAPGRLDSVAANLFVCGDWTATGLPATLEGAARSAETMLQLAAR